MQPANDNQRTRVLVDRRFQMRIVGRQAMMLGISLIVFFVLAMLIPAMFAAAGGSPDWDLLEAVARPRVFFPSLLIPLAAVYTWMLFQGIRDTFRIAGPAYRFRTVFESLARRELPRGVKIRERDELQEVAQALDDALVSLHRDVADLRRTAAEAHDLCEQMKGTESSEDLQSQLSARVQDLHTNLHRFALVTQAPACEPIPEDEGPVEARQWDAVETSNA